MNAEQLLAHFDRIADAPDAIPRLRRFILDLAVRGKLVPQDPNDEPASELLKRIAAVKDRLVKAGKIKGKKIRVRDRENGVDFVSPQGWTLSELGEIAIKITDGTHKTPTYVEKGIPFVSVKDFSAGELTLENTKHITPEEHRLLFKRCDPRRGDILLGRIGTLGKAVLVETDAEFSLFVSVGLIRFEHRHTVPEYLCFVLNSPFVEAEFDQIKIGGGTHTNKLNLGDLHTVALPLPPLAEQQRIIAKVDELMALCDRLEASRAEREVVRDRMATASFARLNAPDSDPAIFQSHATFALNNLTPLTTRPDQIKALRQTILNLAVRGKLVPQDPNDEPASELLKRIAKDFSRQVAEGKLNKPKPVKPLSTKEGLFSLPPGWAEARFNEVAAIQSNLVDPKRYTALPHIAPDNIESWTARLLSYVSVGEAGVHSGKHLFSAGAILYSKIRPNLAKVAKVNFDGLCSADMYPIHPLIDRDFLVKFMITKDFVAQAVKEDNRVAMPKINQSALSDIVVLVPPLAEQHRIVARVDELMALCDQLKASVTKGNDSRRQLLEALLGEVIEPARNRYELAC